MGTKNNSGVFDCYANAQPDEPMFILLARDPSAPSLIEAWAQRRHYAIEQKQRPASDFAMVVEARECAKQMREWREKENGSWRKPIAE